MCKKLLPLLLFCTLLHAPLMCMQGIFYDGIKNLPEFINTLLTTWDNTAKEFFSKETTDVNSQSKNKQNQQENSSEDIYGKCGKIPLMPPSAYMLKLFSACTGQK